MQHAFGTVVKMQNVLADSSPPGPGHSSIGWLALTLRAAKLRISRGLQAPIAFFEQPIVISPYAEPSASISPSGSSTAVLEAHPRVVAYVKNNGLGFEVPYLDGGVARRYLPDFIVRLDVGADEPLNLVLETKSFRGEDAQIKAETMATSWVPGVINLGGFGRWAFAEFRDVYAIEAAFGELARSVRE